MEKYIPDEKRYEKIPYYRCGRTGLQLPGVSLGLWHNFGTNDDFDNMRAMCRTAFDNGITHFDLANNYGPLPGSAEENFNRILKTDFAGLRDELVISTKAGYKMWDGPYGDGGSRKYLLSSLDASLKRMGLDYVDVFYHHRMDKNTPLEESMLALDQAVKSGKALYAGISNYDSETTRKAVSILNELRCPFVLNQVRISMLDRHVEADGLLDLAADWGFGVIAFSPLAQGMLSDKYLQGIPADSRAAKGGFLKPAQITDEKLAQIRALNEIAQSKHMTLAQMALLWVLQKKGITSVLIGASKPDQVKENAEIFSCEPFTAEELAAIDKIAPIV
ncbi:MAG: aldo/keto reductase [Clostridia bacterium]|nr:aldo/keto reductase [Clostridia bacterium]